MTPTSVWLCCLIMAMFLSLVMATTDVQKLSAKRPFCKKRIKYFMNGTCHRCLLKCPDGQMLNKSYNIAMGRNGAMDCFPCMSCPPGTYKTKKTAELYGLECLPERNCTEEGMEFVRHTDGVKQSECGDCLPRFVRNDHGDCFPCTKRNRHEPRCKALFTTAFHPTIVLTTAEPAMVEHISRVFSTRAHVIGTTANGTIAYSDQPLEDKPDPFKMYGILGVILFISLLCFVFLYYQSVRCDLKKKLAAVCRQPQTGGRSFINTASQGSIPNDDLETDCPSSTERLISRNCDSRLSQVERQLSHEDVKHSDIVFLTPEEEDNCRKIKLARGDRYISIVGKKVNSSLGPIYKYLKIPENVIYQNTEIYENTEKNIPEKEVQILNEWLQLSRDGHTLFELYTALKDLKYNYILHHMIPIIWANVHGL